MVLNIHPVILLAVVTLVIQCSLNESVTGVTDDTRKTLRSVYCVFVALSSISSFHPSCVLAESYTVNCIIDTTHSSLCNMPSECKRNNKKRRIELHDMKQLHQVGGNMLYSLREKEAQTSSVDQTDTIPRIKRSRGNKPIDIPDEILYNILLTLCSDTAILNFDKFSFSVPAISKILIASCPKNSVRMSSHDATITLLSSTGDDKLYDMLGKLFSDIIDLPLEEILSHCLATDASLGLQSNYVTPLHQDLVITSHSFHEPVNKAFSNSNRHTLHSSDIPSVFKQSHPYSSYNQVPNFQTNQQPSVPHMTGYQVPVNKPEKFSKCQSSYSSSSSNELPTRGSSYPTRRKSELNRTSSQLPKVRSTRKKRGISPTYREIRNDPTYEYLSNHNQNNATVPYSFDNIHVEALSRRSVNLSSAQNFLCKHEPEDKGYNSSINYLSEQQSFQSQEQVASIHNQTPVNKSTVGYYSEEKPDVQSHSHRTKKQKTSSNKVSKESRGPAQRRQNRSTENLYLCPHCTRSFATKRGLARHLSTHKSQ